MSEKYSSPTRSGSLNDLPISVDEGMDHQITFRKRKQPEQCCNCAQELQSFRQEITNLLEKFTSNQDKFMRENIHEMKSHLKEIKASIETINNEQTNIKTQILNLTDKNNETEKKVETLQKKIIEINANGASKPTLNNNENIMREIQERSFREKNIIVIGVPECRGSNSEERQSSDKNNIFNIMSSIINNCPAPIKIFRLGKYNPTMDRKIKVCFELPQTAKMLLRNKDKLPNGIKIKSDLTPQQQKYLKELKCELEERIKNGEENIRIKYIKSIPTIINSNDTKN